MDRTENLQSTNVELAEVERPQRSAQKYQSINGETEMLREKYTPVSTIETDFVVRPATMDDIESAVELFNICSQNMIGESEHSLPDLRAEWTLPEFDLDSATRMVFSSDGSAIAYIEVWDIDDPPVRNWVWGLVHPEYENRGLGTYLMEWAENRVRSVLTRTPSDLRVTMESGTHSHFEPALRLLEAQNMREIRSFHRMVIELQEMPPEPLWSEGITMRTMKGLDEVRAVVWAIEDAFRDHWGYVEQPFEKEFQRWLHFMKNDELYDPTLWFLAMDGDEIVGISGCKEKSNVDPDMAWVKVLGVRRPWRRRGIALALLHHTFREFYSRGKQRVGLGVDGSSLTGATRLYEKAGMKSVRQFTTFEKEIRPGKDIVRRTLD